MTSTKPAPLSTDSEAVLELQNTEFTGRITYDMIKAKNVHRKIRVYADGIFDLFHFGHAKLFEQCKNAFPGFDVYLIVGICKGVECEVRKGKRVMNDNEILTSIRQCRYVDEVYPACPYCATLEFLDEMKIDFIAHDPLPSYDTVICADPYQVFKDAGCFFPTKRETGISTTDLIARIVKNYDAYARRNLQREHTANIEQSELQTVKQCDSDTYDMLTSNLQKEYVKTYEESLDNNFEIIVQL